MSPTNCSERGVEGWGGKNENRVPCFDAAQTLPSSEKRTFPSSMATSREASRHLPSFLLLCFLLALSCSSPVHAYSFAWPRACDTLIYARGESRIEAMGGQREHDIESLRTEFVAMSNSLLLISSVPGRPSYSQTPSRSRTHRHRCLLVHTHTPHTHNDHV